MIINIVLIILTVALYEINQQLKFKISNEVIKWFMCCYFNDCIGAITFIAYCNIVMCFSKKKLEKLWQIELILFGCGLFWEIITPIYRNDTVTDIFDIVAYMIGGLLYTFIVRKFGGKKE